MLNKKEKSLARLRVDMWIDRINKLQQDNRKVILKQAAAGEYVLYAYVGNDLSSVLMIRKSLNSIETFVSRLYFWEKANKGEKLS